ncbi:MAG: YebC/PmpR family DNA-binding transcriptional regulator [Phycisphaerales bacterium]|nr:YebC/PmpR family DNA-binding transcriptional regulator [Phycisphaerales bacterium]
MAGHSKWANIKHRKARQDAARGKMWSKCSRAIIVAAKNGGGDPAMNLTLRYAIDEARAANMPKDTIEKAVKKGAGETEGESYEETRYEGYGAGGVAVIVDCLTDNVNRTAPEVRKIFEKGGGNLGKPGAVSFGFQQRGLLMIDAAKTTEDQLMELALEAGAEDVVESGGAWEVTCAPTDFMAVREALEAAGIEPDSAEITMIPESTVACDEKTAEKVMRLVDAFEEHDDVQKVYTNADIPDEVLERIG